MVGEPNIEFNIEPYIKPNIEPNFKPNIESNIEPNIEPNSEPNIEPNIVRLILGILCLKNCCPRVSLFSKLLIFHRYNFRRLDGLFVPTSLDS